MTKYQSVTPRIYAALLDLIIYLSVNTLIGLLLVPLRHPSAYLMNTLIVLVSNYAYAVYMAGKYGGTVGKLVFNLRIVNNTTEQPIGIWKAFKRELLNIVTSLPHTAMAILAFLPYSRERLTIVAFPDPATVWFKVDIGIAFLLLTSELGTALFNQKRRALHDFIAGTVVIRVGEYRPYSRLWTIIGFVGIFVLFLATGISERFDQMLKSVM